MERAQNDQLSCSNTRLVGEDIFWRLLGSTVRTPGAYLGTATCSTGGWNLGPWAKTSKLSEYHIILTVDQRNPSQGTSINTPVLR
jgi:hypothetical protein